MVDYVRTLKLVFSRSFLLVLVAMGVAGLPVLAQAQVCGLDGTTSFPGHSLPLNAPPGSSEISLVEAFPNLNDFNDPVFITGAGDGSNRIFVVQQGGSIIVFPNDPNVDESEDEVFLDIENEVVGFAEQGLLGLAFDPDYENNGHFYLNYTSFDPVFRTIVERFTNPDPSSNSVDPSAANRQILVTFDQPNVNHNAGMLAFGPDGYLYVATGDGGGSGDPLNTGQDISDPLGAILRIDPTDGSAAPGNPFIGVSGADDRVYHYGLRNPWRFSFDRVAPFDLWIGDVGQNSREEISRVSSGVAGLNFGWPICEGTADHGGNDCDALSGDVLPVLELPHPSVGSITGGYVYRGSAAPSLQGTYIFGDYSFGTIFGWDRTSTLPGSGLGDYEVLMNSSTPSSFGEDDFGELYVVSLGGKIRKFQQTGGGGSVFPNLLSQTGFFSDTATLTPTPGMVPYDVESRLWSDRAVKQRWVALPAGQSATLSAEGAWTFPVGTAFIKHFELPAAGGGSRRVETRVFLRQTPGWTGVTYRWTQDQGDATLLAGSQSDVFDVEVDGTVVQQTWNYPSPAQCLGCHTEAAGRVLGVRSAQLNNDFGYSAGTDNQLHAWGCAGLLDTKVEDPSVFHSFASLTDTSASRQFRARSYLASNCSMCHQPSGPAPGGLDFRFETVVADMNVVGVAPSEGDLGLNSPDRIKVGQPDESVLWERMATSTALFRMAQGTLVPHAEAVSLFEDWIDFDLSTVDTDEDGVADAVDNCPAVSNGGQANGDSDGLGDACDPDAGADLVADATGPLSVNQGQRASLQGLVSNLGPGDGDVSQVRFYISQDTSFSPGNDPLVGDCSADAVPSGETVTCDDPAAIIPPDLEVIPPGETRSYFWVACADGFDTNLESNESNNCRVASQSILVPESSPWQQAGAALLALALLAIFSRRGRGAEASGLG